MTDFVGFIAMVWYIKSMKSNNQFTRFLFCTWPKMVIRKHFDPRGVLRLCSTTLKGDRRKDEEYNDTAPPIAEVFDMFWNCTIGSRVLEINYPYNTS
jgi:hypothetical protein